MLTAKQLRHTSDTLRELAAGYRISCQSGPQHWREHEAREAERLDRDAAWYAAWAMRLEIQDQEEADERAA